MSQLNVDRQTIYNLFSDKKSDFLIPDYQRPYEWGETECQTLWDDLFLFAFPDEDCDKFKRDDEYFLGPIVTYMNDRKMEIIDGQQRLTTLMLLLRAFYSRFLNMQDKNSAGTRDAIARCIWKTDEFNNLIQDELKIDSQVSTDDDKEEFLAILRSGKLEKTHASKYAKVFSFFQSKIDEFIGRYPAYCAYLPARIMNNCILLPIEADTQDTALRIFSTLNDRGLPLSDSDIFKAQLYKYYRDKGKKDFFIENWKNLDDMCRGIFRTASGTAMDELFTRYMYFERAKQGNRNSTTEALRAFYEKDNYKLLKNDEILDNLRTLALFWNDVAAQSPDRFSDDVLRRLFVLNYAPNGMWTYFVSVYFMQNRDQNGLLENNEFVAFLDRITAFIWTYAVINPGVNALRTPVFAEMINIVTCKPVQFSSYKFDMNMVKNLFENFRFVNNRPITRAMLAWWVLQDSEQPLLDLDTTFEIEHIFAVKRQRREHSLRNENSLELLGNKALLEKKINIRASDYRFTDKKIHYKGGIASRGKRAKKGTQIRELLMLADQKNDFTEADIVERNQKIIHHFLDFVQRNGLAKEESITL